MSGKGDSRRKPLIDKVMEDLRWELISSKTTPERKQQILEIIELQKQQEIIQPIDEDFYLTN